MPAARTDADIHPTAIVDRSAQLDPSVTVGPYCVIEAGVAIGAGTSLMHHASIHSGTTLGKNNTIYPYACLGHDPQDNQYQPGQTSLLEIGDDNVIREFVTINRGTPAGGGVTRVGNGNMLMVNTHIGHDCQVANQVVMTTGVILAGHVQIEDHCYMGGYTAVHQFCKIGCNAMTGGQTVVVQDIPPCTIAAGNRARLFGINRIGLERRGIAPEEIKALHDAYRIYFMGKLRAKTALERIESQLGHWNQVRHFIDFIRASERGITH